MTQKQKELFLQDISFNPFYREKQILKRYIKSVLSYKIRYQSDKLCKENNLSVINEYYESYKKKYKTSGKSWYENE